MKKRYDYVIVGGGVAADKAARAIRKRDDRLGGVEDMLREFALSTREGLALMVLAEALLRVELLGHRFRVLALDGGALDAHFIFAHHLGRGDSVLVGDAVVELLLGQAGGLGGVGINLVLRSSYKSNQSATQAFWIFLAFYVVAAGITYWFYVRRSIESTDKTRALEDSSTTTPVTA